MSELISVQFFCFVQTRKNSGKKEKSKKWKEVNE